MLYSDIDNVADARFEQVLEAIEAKDAEMLKSFFSEKALSEAEDIDGSIESLFNLIEGDVVSWERETVGSGETIKSGKVSRHIYSWYILETTEGVFLFFMLDYDKDTLDPSNQGLYALQGLDEENGHMQYNTSQGKSNPGVNVTQNYSQS